MGFLPWGYFFHQHAEACLWGSQHVCCPEASAYMLYPLTDILSSLSKEDETPALSLP